MPVNNFGTSKINRVLPIKTFKTIMSARAVLQGRGSTVERRFPLILFEAFMENTGWVKIHRKLMDSKFGKNYEMIGFFTTLLMKATHKDGYAPDGTFLKRGQVLTSFVALSHESGLNRNKLMRLALKLENEHQIEQLKTQKNTIITITNYDSYQSSEHQNEHQVNIERTSDEHQVNTFKNVKNVKNVKKENILAFEEAQSSTDLLASEIKDLWNKAAKQADLTEIKFLNDKRKKKVLDAIKEVPTIQDWKYIITQVGVDDFRMGINDRGWKASFDWLFQEKKGSGSKNYQLMLEEYESQHREAQQW